MSLSISVAMFDVSDLATLGRCVSDCCSSPTAFSSRLSFDPPFCDQRRNRVAFESWADVDLDIGGRGADVPLSLGASCTEVETRRGRPHRASQEQNAMRLCQPMSQRVRQNSIPRVVFSDPMSRKNGMQTVAVTIPKVQ